MKTLFLFCAAAAISNARPGETPAEIEQRFGKPTHFYTYQELQFSKEKTTNSTQDTAIRYNFKNIRVIVHFFNNRSVFEKYDFSELDSFMDDFKWPKEVKEFQNKILDAASAGEPWILEFFNKEAKVDYLTLEDAKNEIERDSLFGMRAKREPERIQKFGPYYKSRGLTASVVLEKQIKRYVTTLGDTKLENQEERLVPCLIVETDNFRALRLPSSVKKPPAPNPAQPAQTQGKGF